MANNRKRKAEKDNQDVDDDELAPAAELEASPEMLLRSTKRSKRSDTTNRGIPKQNGQQSAQMDDVAEDDDEIEEDNENGIESQNGDDQSMRDCEPDDDRKVAAVETWPTAAAAAAASSSFVPPTNGVHLVASVAATATAAERRKVPKITTLTLPSERTPGRSRMDATPILHPNRQEQRMGAKRRPSLQLFLSDDEPKSSTMTTTAKNATIIQQSNQSEAQRSPDQMLQEEDLYLPHPIEILEPPLERLHDWLYRVSTESMVRLHEYAHQMIAPEPVAANQQEIPAVVQEHNNEEDGDEDKVSRHLQKTRVWMVIFIVFATCLQLLIHPILSSAVGLAREAIPFYKGLAPRSTPLTASSSPMETTTSPAELQTTQRVRDLTELSVRLRRDLASARERLFQDLAALENESIQLIPSDQKQDIQLESLKKSVDAVQSILNREEMISSAAVAGIRSALGESMADYILDLGSIELLDGDDGVDTNEPDSSLMCPSELQRNDVIRAVKELKNEMIVDSDAIRADATIVDMVVEWSLQNRVAVVAPPKPMGSSIGTIRKMISARLQLEWADRTGKVDYAALYNGAEILTNGENPTTSSLFDNLPILNRMFAKLGLRFYGHGPDAALSPTFPVGSLGQCWAVEKVMKTSASASAGNFATLSLRLAKPIYVKSVSIEQPPEQVTDNKAKSAIRKFRVFGFQSADASGQAWEIGSFEYLISGGKILQEFEVSDEVRNVDVPALHSISLAIDSTWGLPYACLYRFRVHGKEAATAYS
jgi:hypothetical protein